MTQSELADRVGCSTAAIRKFESEERRPSVQIIERLAVIFELSPEERGSFRDFARGRQLASLELKSRESPWQAATRQPRANLPVPSTALLGRDLERAELQAYLTDPAVRLVSLIGPLGIGKTRLSLDVGREVLPEFPDGVFFVALAELDEAALVVPAVIQSLGYVQTKDCSAVEQLIEGIGDQHVLIILDNCEHLTEGVALLVPELLSACPGLKILTTSREALRVPGEWLYVLPPLQIPPQNMPVGVESVTHYPALALFAERARAVSTDFMITPGNLQAVTSICSRLDGLPLAIELIAARIRLMSPQSLLERMTDQFILSADGMRGVTPRQKTLQNAISWSYDLLTPDEQRVFTSLAVFMGGFTLPAAESVLGDSFAGKSVPDLVASLLDKSLLQRSFGPDDEPRFYQLFTIQQFALNHLRSLGNEKEARDRHLAYFLDFAVRADREMHAPEQAAWIERVESEHANLRAALDWCVAQLRTGDGLRLLSALGWPWEIRSHYREMSGWFEKMRALPGVVDYPSIYAELLDHVGRHLWTQANWEDAQHLLEESRVIWEGLGEQGEQGLAEALNWLGIVALYGLGSPEQAGVYLAHSRELFHKWDNPREALSIFHLGILALEQDRGQEAKAYLEQSLARFQEMGDLFNIARVSTYLGDLYRKLGDYKMARHFFEQHLMIDSRLQFWDGMVDALNSLGYLARLQGEFDQAEGYFQQSLVICQEHGLIIRQP